MFDLAWPFDSTRGRVNYFYKEGVLQFNSGLLELTNGDLLAAQLQRGGTAWSADKKQAPEAVVDRLFREALGRTPTPKERMTALQAVGTPLSPQGIEDLLWMIAMLPEFQLIY